jgi:hypothetical protein
MDLEPLKDGMMHMLIALEMSKRTTLQLGQQDSTPPLNQPLHPEVGILEVEEDPQNILRCF